MKKLIYTAICASLAFGFSSCQQDDSSANEGAITIAANIDDHATVRSGETETLKNSAKVNIYLPDFQGLIRQYTYSDMPELIYLPEAQGYRVDVEAGERVAANPQIASFESKSYKGSASFNVTAGYVNTTPIEVEAKICNAITNVTFGNGVEEAFEDGYQLSIGLDNNNLVYTASNGGTDGYFIIEDDADEPTLDWTFTGTLTKGGTQFTKSGSFEVEQGKRYLMNVVYTEHNGVLKVVILLDKSTSDKDDTIIFEPLSTGIERTRPQEIWATHTTLRAVVDLETYNEKGVFFEYRKQGGTNWTRSNAADKVSENGEFSLLVSGLDPEATYEYQLVVTPKDTTKPEELIVSDPINTITMKAALQVPNASFEETTDSGNFTSFYYPNSTIESNKTMWWDTGNEGSTAVGSSGVIAYSDTSTAKDGSKSVRLESKYVVIKFAAGNLFCGRFGAIKGTEGGTVYFGRPFIGRPSKMKLWVKYETGKVNHVKKNLKDGDYDICQAKVALGAWTTSYTKENIKYPLLVDTTDESTFVDFDTDPSTIAYGDLQITGAADAANYLATINGSVATLPAGSKWTEWQEVVIPLEYHSLTTIPTHIVISFAASKYGDYFEGSTSSKMWVDGIELIYDSEITTKNN